MPSQQCDVQSAQQEPVVPLVMHAQYSGLVKQLVATEKKMIVKQETRKQVKRIRYVVTRPAGVNAKLA